MSGASWFASSSLRGPVLRTTMRRMPSPPPSASNVGIDLDLQMVGGRDRREAVQPLDRRRRVVVRLGEPQLGELRRLVDAVQIGVHERHAARMLVHQRERRACDVPVRRHLEPARDALRERGLPRAERPEQADDVANLQEPPETFTERLHVSRRGGREDSLPTAQALTSRDCTAMEFPGRSQPVQAKSVFPDALRQTFPSVPDRTPSEVARTADVRQVDPEVATCDGGGKVDDGGGRQ